jgi:hypothetical protein
MTHFFPLLPDAAGVGLIPGLRLPAEDSIVSIHQFRHDFTGNFL